ncbi:MAG: sensor histidine kinase [Myxococcota bacterium]
MPRRWQLLPDDPEIGWIPYVWLLYLGFVVLTPVFGDLTEDMTMWAVTGITTALFVPLYFLGYWYRGTARIKLALGMCVLGIVLAPFNPGGSTFFIYAAYFAGLYDDRIGRSMAAVGLVLVVLVAAAFLVQPIIYFWAPGGMGVVVIGLIGSHNARSHSRIEELRLARAEVETLARIAERERIAADLHDLLGHSLSVIALKSELAQHLVERDAARATQEMTDVHEVARKALSEVRTAVGGYRVGSGAGLRQELDGAERALEAAGVALIVVEGPEHVAKSLDAAHEGVLALALREAATNIMRHARASKCELTFFGESEGCGLEIRDDGRGVRGTPGHGLQTMKRRVEAQGGTMEIVSDAEGTRLRVMLDPVAQEGAA